MMAALCTCADLSRQLAWLLQGAVTTMAGTMIKKPGSRAAAVTMLGKTVDLASQLVSICRLGCSRMHIGHTCRVEHACA